MNMRIESGFDPGIITFFAPGNKVIYCLLWPVGIEYLYNVALRFQILADICQGSSSLERKDGSWCPVSGNRPAGKIITAVITNVEFSGRDNFLNIDESFWNMRFLRTSGGHQYEQESQYKYIRSFSDQGFHTSIIPGPV